MMVRYDNKHHPTTSSCNPHRSLTSSENPRKVTVSPNREAGSSSVPTIFQGRAVKLRGVYPFCLGAPKCRKFPLFPCHFCAIFSERPLWLARRMASSKLCRLAKVTSALLLWAHSGTCLSRGERGRLEYHVLLTPGYIYYINHGLSAGVRLPENLVDVCHSSRQVCICDKTCSANSPN